MAGPALPPLVWMIAVAVILATFATGCAGDPEVLPNEAFRSFVPENALLYDETVDDGSSLVEGGEQSVLRTFVPKPPADEADVLAVLFHEGEREGWALDERSATLAVGTKEIEGWPWMVSLVIDDGTVKQLFSGR